MITPLDAAKAYAAVQSTDAGGAAYAAASVGG